MMFEGKYYEMISFGEKRALKQAREDPVYWVQYNQKQMTRVYPGGGRIDSSNLDPVTMWNVGCQLGQYYIQLILLRSVRNIFD